MISVIMAVFNGEKYISEAIDSILCQTYLKFEFIIINDCSNDQTYAILESYEKKDARLIIYRNNKNLGLTKSLNIGLKLSKGKYIARMDADDISHPTRFAKQVSFMGKHPETGILGTAYEVIDEEGKLIHCSSQPTEDEGIRWQTLFHNSFCHPSIIVRKSILDQNNIRYGNLHYAQDYKFTSQILEYSKGANLPEFLIQWRSSSTQISSRKKEDQQRAANKISKENIALLMDREFLTIEEVQKLRNLYYLKSSVKKDELPLLMKWIVIFHTYLSKNEFHHNDVEIKAISGQLVRIICSLTMRQFPLRKILKIIYQCIRINRLETIKQMKKYYFRMILLSSLL